MNTEYYLSKELKGEQLAEMFDMYKAGALAFTDNMRPVLNSGLFSRALLYSKNFNGLIISFPYEKSISPNGIINEGIVSTKLGIEGIPDLSKKKIEFLENRLYVINTSISEVNEVNPYPLIFISADIVLFIKYTSKHINICLIFTIQRSCLAFYRI